MSVCRIIETGVTPDDYDRVSAGLGVSEGNPPPGAQLHVAAVGEDGNVTIVEVWESREEAEDWNSKVREVRESAGVGGPAPTISYLDVHRAIRG